MRDREGRSRTGEVQTARRLVRVFPHAMGLAYGALATPQETPNFPGMTDFDGNTAGHGWQ